MRGVSRGYRELALESVRVGSWTAGIVGGKVHDAPRSLDEWTQGIDIEIDAVLEIDAEAAKEYLQLSPAAELGVQTLWHSPGTKLRGASSIVPIIADEVNTSLRVTGHHIRKNLRIEHVVVVTNPGPMKREFAPAIVGAIVWSADPETIRLEGIAPRLPVLPRKFSSEVGFEGKHGMWWLKILTTDLEADAAAAIWLWVNSENDQIAAMLDDPESEASRTLVSMLGADVGRQLILWALRNGDFDSAFPYSTGSLGMVLRNLVNLMSRDIADLDFLLQDAPMELDALIQARTAGVLR